MLQVLVVREVYKVTRAFTVPFCGLLLMLEILPNSKA